MKIIYFAIIAIFNTINAQEISLYEQINTFLEKNIKDYKTVNQNNKHAIIQEAQKFNSYILSAIKKYKQTLTPSTLEYFIDNIIITKEYAIAYASHPLEGIQKLFSILYLQKNFLDIVYAEVTLASTRSFNIDQQISLMSLLSLKELASEKQQNISKLLQIIYQRGTIAKIDDDTVQELLNSLL